MNYNNYNYNNYENYDTTNPNNYNHSPNYSPVPNNYHPNLVGQLNLKLKYVSYFVGIIFITLLITCMVATMHSCGVNIMETIKTGQWAVSPSRPNKHPADMTYFERLGAKINYNMEVKPIRSLLLLFTLGLFYVMYILYCGSAWSSAEQMEYQRVLREKKAK